MVFFFALLRLLFNSHISFFGILLLKNLRILIASFKACLACFPKVLIGGEVGDSWLAASAMEKCGSLGEPRRGNEFLLLGLKTLIRQR